MCRSGCKSSLLKGKDKCNKDKGPWEVCQHWVKTFLDASCDVGRMRSTINDWKNMSSLKASLYDLKRSDNVSQWYPQAAKRFSIISPFCLTLPRKHQQDWFAWHNLVKDVRYGWHVVIVLSVHNAWSYLTGEIMGKPASLAWTKNDTTNSSTSFGG